MSNRKKGKKTQKLNQLVYIDKTKVKVTCDVKAT